MKHLHLFTSESVGEGHPDKVADYISDTILDACLEQDPDSRVACETLVKDQHVVLAGEITTTARLDYDRLVRDTIRAIGYRTADDDPVFNAESVDITNYLSTQSPDIAQGVDAREADGKEGSEQGAGDQGIMFGFASDETPELMPAPIMFSHRIMRELARVRHSGEVPWLRPDSKSQVAIEYGEDGKPARILNVVLSTQHREEVSIETIRSFCRDLILRVLPADLITPETEFFINPTGRFVIGGPHGDSGLRSGAYMCRWVAKHIVAAGLASRCELQVAYAIGKASPVSIMLDVQTYGTAKLPEEEIIRRVNKAFSFKPADMIAALGLKRPIFRHSTNYGHFTKADLPWETLDEQKLDILRRG